MFVLVLSIAFLLAAASLYVSFQAAASIGHYPKRVRPFLTALAAVVMGLGAWAVHALTALAGRVQMLHLAFDAFLWISILVLVVSAYAAIAVTAISLSKGLRSFIGGIVLALGISLSHLIGMIASQSSDTFLQELHYLSGSILISLLGGSAAFRLLLAQRFNRRRIGYALSALVLAVTVVGMQHVAKQGFVIVGGGFGTGKVTQWEEEAGARFILFALAAALALGIGTYRAIARVSNEFSAVERRRALYYDIFRHAKDAILILHSDEAGTVKELNDQALRLLGRQRQDIVGVPLKSIVPGRLPRRREGGAAGEGEEWQIEIGDGRARTAEAYERTVEAGGGEGAGAVFRVIYLRDITDIKQEQEIVSLVKPLTLVGVSGLPPARLLALLAYLTTRLFPGTELRFDEEHIQGFGGLRGAPSSWSVHSRGGLELARLSLVDTATGEGVVPSGAEETWLEKCADLLEIAARPDEETAWSFDLPDEAGYNIWSGVCDGELKLEYVGRHSRQMLGREPADLECRTLLELFHPEDARRFLQRYRSAGELEAPTRFRVRLLHSNGSWVETNMTIAASSGVERQTVLFMAERTADLPDLLTDFGRRYSDLFERYPGPVCCFDLEGRFVQVNESLERLTGYSAAELLGHTFESLIHEDDLEMTRTYFSRAAAGENIAYAVRLRNRDGESLRVAAVNFQITAGLEAAGVFGIAVVIPFSNETAVRNEEIPFDSSAQEMKLTKREREVIHLVLQDFSNKEIAAQLSISENTVKNHISNIFMKLSINDRSQLAERLGVSGIQDGYTVENDP